MSLKSSITDDILSVLLDTNEFAESAIFKPSGGDTVGVTVIFDNEPVSIDPYSGEVQDRILECAGASSELSTAKHKDIIEIDSVEYEIKRNETDGTGVTTLILNEN